MARVLALIALCVLPVLVSAGRSLNNPFTVSGRVYCDTCRAGYETSATTNIPGARVKIECKDRESMKLLFVAGGVTDSTGTFNIDVDEDHLDEICDAVLVSSPQANCAKADPGRDRTRVILTNTNGIVSNKRFANAMGFMRDQSLPECTQVLKQYEDDE